MGEWGSDLIKGVLPHVNNILFYLGWTLFQCCWKRGETSADRIHSTLLRSKQLTYMSSTYTGMLRISNLLGNGHFGAQFPVTKTCQPVMVYLFWQQPSATQEDRRGKKLPTSYQWASLWITSSDRSFIAVTSEWLTGPQRSASFLNHDPPRMGTLPLCSILF